MVLKQPPGKLPSVQVQSLQIVQCVAISQSLVHGRTPSGVVAATSISATPISSAAASEPSTLTTASALTATSWTAAAAAASMAKSTSSATFSASAIGAAAAAANTCSKAPPAR